MSKAIVKAAEELCEQQGERLTELRQTVLEILSKEQGALTAYQLLEKLQQIRPGAKPPTVYRALEFLQQLGLVHKIDSSNAFLVCHHTHGAHQAQFLICNQCGAIQEFDLPEIAKPISRMAKDNGFQIESETIEIRGLCKQCLRSA